MRGSLVARGPNRYAIVLDMGRTVDPVTGTAKRRQKWVTFKPPAGLTLREGRRAALAKLAELVNSHNRGEFVEPSKLTLVAWLRQWLETYIKPPLRRPATYRLYRIVIEHHIAVAPIGSMPLQKIRPLDIEQYLSSLDAEPATVRVHQAVIRSGLKKASRNRLITNNPAADVERRQLTEDQQPAAAAKAHCLTAEQVKALLRVAREEGPQAEAFYALAVSSGARKSELLALPWTAIDFERSTIRIDRQLTSRAGHAPEFGPPKTKASNRIITIDATTLALLKEHRRNQSEIKMRHRTSYRDFGLVFAKEPGDVRTPRARCGDSMAGLLDGSTFVRLCKAAGLPATRPHALRHTAATLLIADGEPITDVSNRLGHSKSSMTLDIYAHAMPARATQTAAKIGRLIHGS